MMNAAGALRPLFSQQMLFIRNHTVNMMYARSYLAHELHCLYSGPVGLWNEKYRIVGFPIEAQYLLDIPKQRLSLCRKHSIPAKLK